MLHFKTLLEALAESVGIIIMAYYPIMMKCHKKKKANWITKKNFKWNSILCTMKPMLQKSNQTKTQQLTYIVTNIRTATKMELLPYAFMEVSEIAL